MSQKTTYSNLSTKDELFFANFQGSASTPYNTAFDQTTQTFKCSCPSRQYPCKHAEALGQLIKDQLSDFVVVDELPQWVQTWIDNKNKLAEKKASKTSEILKDTSKAKEKLLQKLLKQYSLLKETLDEVGSWLEKWDKLGLADALTIIENDKATIIGRFKDLKLPNLAYYIDDITSQNSEEERKLTLKQFLARTYLCLSGINKITSLYNDKFQLIEADNSNADHINRLFTFGNYLGLTQKTSDFDWDLQLQRTGTWLVTSLKYFTLDKLVARHIWLKQVETGEYALLIDYSPNGKAKFSTDLVLGSYIEAKICYYPSLSNKRAVILESKNLENETRNISTGSYKTLTQWWTEAGKEQFTNNPLQGGIICNLEKISILKIDENYVLVDSQSNILPINLGKNLQYKLLEVTLAQSFGLYFTYFNGQIDLLSINLNNNLHSLAPTIDLSKKTKTKENTPSNNFNILN
jgi:hypothetical protein